MSDHFKIMLAVNFSVMVKEFKANALNQGVRVVDFENQRNIK